MLVAIPCPGLASPDACSGTSSLTCAGDQSGGIDIGPDKSPPVRAVVVDKLSSAIAPAAGHAGIRLHSGSGQAVSATAGSTAVPLTINATGKDAGGIVVHSFGAPTPYVELPDFLQPGTANAFPTGPAGGGGDVTVDIHANITTDGSNAPGISARSRSGGYPEAVLNTMAALVGTGQSATFRLSTVNGDAANIGKEVAGSNGGKFTLTNATAGASYPGFNYTLDDMNLASLQLGQSIDTTVPYHVVSAAGLAESDAWLTVRITRLDDGTLGVQSATYFGAYGHAFEASRATYASGAGQAGQLTLQPDFDTYLKRLQSDSAPGGAGGNVTVTASGSIETRADASLGQDSYGIVAESRSGSGSAGSSGVFVGDPGQAGPAGGVVSVTNLASIHTYGMGAHGIVASSAGGDGGRGGSSDFIGKGGAGGNGGKGGAVSLVNTGNITTEQANAFGIFAQSAGGRAGQGGDGGWFIYGSGGGGGTSQVNDAVQVSNSGAIITKGDDSHGILAQSIGGFGGSGGGAGGLLFYASGASGGSTGSGGVVTVTNTGTVQTSGENANALLAQSIGGGGGAGGTSAGWFGGGGSGSNGGDGGNVTVTNSADLTTSKRNASAIFAQSVGGGGGNGGGAISAGAFLSVAIGGGGGFGGDGGTVVAKSKGGALGTSEDQSHGIYAQSVGGRGGSGGYAVSVAAGKGFSAAIAVGGSGGKGGNGSGVQVESSSAIATTGEGAYGVYAQSVGGGGGTGGFAVAASGSVEGISASFAIGGDGAAGGNGGQVDVGKDAPLAGSIHTSGAQAHGVVAQSVGGGGGRGGLSVANSISVSASASASLTMSLGGTGGVGGAADAVTVRSAAEITTDGERAYGIKAQSVGGGGGDGGVAVGGSIGGPGSMALVVTVGGSAGDGSSGGRVTVDASGGSIETQGKDAHGIFAQSVGGGGGDGAIGVSGSLGVGTNSTSIDVAAGGSGGKGSVGQRVEVDNAAELTTHGDAAFGIFAQSIGGGGGMGGAAYSGNATLKTPQGGYSAKFNFAFGGSGGDGNTGGVIAVTNTGTITTHGTSAHGIFAESVGGGGGQGGSARTMVITLPTEPESRALGKNMAFSLNLGGSGGTGGDGSTVAVTNQGTITTYGPDSHGIYAQSVGAGGGSGGEGAHGFFGVPTVGIDKTAIWGNVMLSLGGSAGAAGSGKGVTVHQESGAITTYQDGSYGIFAQSVGGGGGNGGKGVIGATGTLGIGGKGGTSGDGGAVDVTVNGRIDTYGGDAFGVFAQSVGGGGGIAGSIDRGFTSNFKAGGIGGFGITRNAGNGGNGGLVTVGGTGTIHTRGDASTGILAQSVGGGGGMAGTGSGVAGFQAWAGSAGGNGSGGLITVDWTGSIITEGANAYGIFAQSAGGEATDVVVYDDKGIPTGKTLARLQNLGQDVAITVHGSVIAKGAGSNAIHAQSEGDQGNGDITVKILDKGMVMAGAGADVVAVRLVGGKDNRVENTGWIGTARGVAGNAVRGDDGNDVLDNQGSIVGSIDLGSGANVLDNRKGGVLDSGSLLFLGAGRALNNSGRLAPGGDGVVQNTTLTGDLHQSADGTLSIDLSLARLGSDRLTIAGSAALGGSVDVHPVDKGYARPGTQRVTVLSATGGITTDALRLTGHTSPLVHYSLDTGAAGEIGLSSAVDFSPRDLNANEQRLGTHINAIQSAGGSAAIAPFVARLIDLPDAASVALAYGQLLPVAAQSIATASTGSTLAFNDAMHSCRQREGDFRFMREGECSWAQARGGERNQRSSSDNPGYRQDRRIIAAGLQRELRADTYLGFGVAYEETRLRSESSSVDGKQVLAGVVLKRSHGATKVSASFSAGSGQFDSTRRIDLLEPGQLARGSQQALSASAHARVSQDTMLNGNGFVRPILDLGVTHVHRRAYRESGADGASLDVRAEKDTLVTLQPAVEFGSEHSLDNGSLFRPFLRVGMTHYLTPNEHQITASLQGAQEGIAPFTITNRADRSFGDVSIGVDVLDRNGASVRFDYSGQFSRKSSDSSVAVKVAIPF